MHFEPARGHVLKSDAEQELVRALNVVLGEGTYVSPTIDANVAQKVVEEIAASSRTSRHLAGYSLSHRSNLCQSQLRMQNRQVILMIEVIRCRTKGANSQVCLWGLALVWDWRSCLHRNRGMKLASGSVSMSRIDSDRFVGGAKD